jgi:hypothetical protein
MALQNFLLLTITLYLLINFSLLLPLPYSLQSGVQTKYLLLSCNVDTYWETSTQCKDVYKQWQSSHLFSAGSWEKQKVAYYY